MKSRPPKNDKEEIRREMHPTRPPRMEGKVKEAMMQPVRKKKKARGSGKQEQVRLFSSR